MYYIINTTVNQLGVLTCKYKNCWKANKANNANHKNQKLETLLLKIYSNKVLVNTNLKRVLMHLVNVKNVNGKRKSNELI